MKIKYCEKIMYCTAKNNSLYDKNININKIIENNYQHTIGDCWALASLDAMKESKKASAVLANAVSEVKKGYSVEFKGLNESYIVEYDELFKAIDDGVHASGDADVVLWELALEKALDDNSELQSEHATKEGSISIDGGSFELFMKILTGDKVQTVMGNCDYSIFNFIYKPLDSLIVKHSFNSVFDKIEDSSTDCVAIIAFAPDNNESRYITDVSGERREATGAGDNHGWAIISVKDDCVTMVNPYNSSEEVVVYRDELIKNALFIEYFVF